MKLKASVLKICAVALPLIALTTVAVRADVKTRDRSSFKLEGIAGRIVGMFAGKAAKEGVESSTAVKGNRLSRLNENTGQIIDLSEEKVYQLDMKKKTYSVMTFEQIRQQMREQEEKAKKQAEKEAPSEKQPEKPQKELDVDFDVKETGNKKQIAGYDTHESVMTITVREKGKTLEESGGLVLTSNIFLGPEVPQMKELAEFELRYWKAIAGPQIAAMSADQMATVMAMYPMIKNAMDRMQKEGTKLQGTPLETTTTFEAVKSKDEMTQAQQQQPSGGGGGLGGMFAKKIMKKGNDEPKARATVMTLHHEVLNLATSVDASDLAIPPDFKEKK